MLDFAILCLLLSAFVRANFDGQLTSVFASINFPDDGLMVTNQTHSSAFDIGPIFLSNVPGDESHFQYVADFSNVLETVPPGLGANSNPQYGCLLIGTIVYNALLFCLTNSQVYVIVASGEAFWAIPVKRRTLTEINTYTIVIRRDVNKVSFRIDNIEVAEVPGFCGIDNKFLVSGTPPPGCQPQLNDTPVALSIFYLNRLTIPVENGFCQVGQYDICLDNISSASHCRCQREVVPYYNGTITMEAHVRSFEAFTVSGTNRCDGDSSTSENHNWWQRPIKADEQL